MKQDDLAEFLKAASGRPFSWGQWDCLAWLGSWVAVRHGVNPAEPFTARYRTARGALRVLREHGGMAGLIAAAVSPLCLAGTDEPRAGDIAIVDAPEGEMGAIVTGKFVASIGDGGIHMRRLPILRAWRV